MAFIADTTAQSVDQLLERVVTLNASDLHITAGSRPAYRVRGSLVRYDEMSPLTPEQTREMLYRILSTEQQKRLEIHRQLDFAYSVPGLARFRVNVYSQRESLAAAFRLIPMELKTLEELGLPQSLIELTQKPRGIVLVTGPTGSGKSTTLAAMIDEINRTRHDHILTIEDPIEFLHRHKNCVVNQREIGPDATSFTDALKAALRQDPDVILVGEMRDLETISIALTAAETGHLVFGTLHTQSAPSTIDRIIDVFPAEQQDQVRTMISDLAPGRHHADARADRRRPGPRAGARDPAPRRRDPEPDPPGQGGAGLLLHADRHEARDADDGAVPRRPDAAPGDRPGGGDLAHEPSRPVRRDPPARRHERALQPRRNSRRCSCGCSPSSRPVGPHHRDVRRPHHHARHGPARTGRSRARRRRPSSRSCRPHPRRRRPSARPSPRSGRPARHDASAGSAAGAAAAAAASRRRRRWQPPAMAPPAAPAPAAPMVSPPAAAARAASRRRPPGRPRPSFPSRPSRAPAAPAAPPAPVAAPAAPVAAPVPPAPPAFVPPVVSDDDDEPAAKVPWYKKEVGGGKGKAKQEKAPKAKKRKGEGSRSPPRPPLRAGVAAPAEKTALVQARGRRRQEEEQGSPSRSSPRSRPWTPRRAAARGSGEDAVVQARGRRRQEEEGQERASACSRRGAGRDGPAPGDPARWRARPRRRRGPGRRRPGGEAVPARPPERPRQEAAAPVADANGIVLAPEPKKPLWKRELGGEKSDKMLRDVLGLKIGASQIAAAKVVNANGQAEVVQLARERLERGIVVGGELRDPNGLALALGDFFKKHRLPKKNVRLGVANNRVNVRILDIAGAAMSPKQLENAIRFRAQEALPIAIDDAVLDYQVLSQSVNAEGELVHRVLLVVAYRDLIDRYVEACRKAGIRLVGIDLEAFALLRALTVPTDGRRAPDAAQVVVSVGHDRSTFAVSDGKICEFTRVLDWGGSALDIAIARQLNLTPSDAEPIKWAVALDRRSARSRTA